MKQKQLKRQHSYLRLLLCIGNVTRKTFSLCFPCNIIAYRVDVEIVTCNIIPLYNSCHNGTKICKHIHKVQETEYMKDIRPLIKIMSYCLQTSQHITENVSFWPSLLHPLFTKYQFLHYLIPTLPLHQLHHSYGLLILRQETRSTTMFQTNFVSPPWVPTLRESKLTQRMILQFCSF